MNTKTIYMIGIGGIGMSALAQLYSAQGHAVSGSDRESSPTTELLEKESIKVFIGEDPKHVPEGVNFVVYSDAVHGDNRERMLVAEKNIPELSYFEALGEASKQFFTIAVGGSHGKTTTTAMVAKVLHDVDVAPTAVVGSLVKDFGSNFLNGEPESPFIVEACEYNDHILKLSPSILTVTNLEWDHTDYFKTFDDLKKTFIQAIKSVPENGAVILDLESDIGKELAGHATCKVINYREFSVPTLKLLGEFNERNAQAAKATALAYDQSLDEKVIDVALQNFEGSWRRFEYIGAMKNGAVVYDDYAHHPTEIVETLKEVKKKFPDKKIVVAFHPHLYTRTHDLMDEFSVAFKDANEVIIAPIYPAREDPIPGVTNETLAENISKKGTSATYGTFDGIEQFFKDRDTNDTLLLTMGAGDIYKVAKKLV